jgi:hypothetical protein
VFNRGKRNDLFRASLFQRVIDMKSRAALFDSRMEKINLWLPIVFLVAALVQIVLRFDLSPRAYSSAFFIANVILLNHTHTIFTLLLVLFFPEVGQWSSLRRGKSKYNAWMEWTVVFAVIWIVTHLFTTKLNSWSPNLGYPLMITALYWYAGHHNVSQTMGLSLLYDRIVSGHNHEGFEKVMPKSKAWERRLLFASTTIVYTSLMFGSVEATKDLIWVKLLPLLSIGLLTINLWMSYRNPAHRESNKTFFLWRTFLLPLLRYSTIAEVGFISVHGVEYFFVFQKMISRSRVKTILTRFMIGQMVLIIAGLCALHLLTYPFFKDLVTPLGFGDAVITLLLSISVTFVFLHYYLDGLMFRMRRPEVREHILPLLVTNDSD